MACEMQLHGEIAAIRVKLVVSSQGSAADLPSDPDKALINRLRGRDSSYPSGIEEVKDGLTAETKRAFDSPDFEVSAVRVEQGSVEILVVISAIVTVVKEFGSISQGLREMAAYVPGPLRRLATRHAQSLFGHDAGIEMPREPAIEMHSGILGAGAAAPGREIERVERPSVGERPRAPTDVSATTVTKYLVASHATLTVALAAAVVVLVVEQV